MTLLDIIRQPWPWYIAGPLIGMTVPTLLLLGNKTFGISSSLRHVCAACMPANIPFFKYNWKKEIWNLLFVAGIFIGSIMAMHWLSNPSTVQVSPKLMAHLAQYGITDFGSMMPSQLFSWDSLFTLRGFVIMVMGGFLIGFGTRYSGGCTSGHAIMGLSSLQWPSLIATCCFMAGGFFMANIILPFILSL